MFIHYGGPNPWQCTGGGIRIVINNFSGSQSLMLMTHIASHARCVTVEPTAKMHVQNYAGSWIKHGNCWKCSSDWHGICVHYLYIVGQHFNWYRGRAGLSVIAEALVQMIFFHPHNFDPSITYFQNAFQQISPWMTASLLTHLRLNSCLLDSKTTSQNTHLTRQYANRSWYWYRTITDPLWIRSALVHLSGPPPICNNHWRWSVSYVAPLEWRCMCSAHVGPAVYLDLCIMGELWVGSVGQTCWWPTGCRSNVKLCMTAHTHTHQDKIMAIRQVGTVLNMTDWWKMQLTYCLACSWHGTANWMTATVLNLLANPYLKTNYLNNSKIRVLLMLVKVKITNRSKLEIWPFSTVLNYKMSNSSE